LGVESWENLSAKGEIAIFILKLSSKAQIHPSTIKMVGLVLEFAISVRFHPLPDVVFHTEAYSVSTVLLGDQKRWLKTSHPWITAWHGCICIQLDNMMICIVIDKGCEKKYVNRCIVGMKTDRIGVDNASSYPNPFFYRIWSGSDIIQIWMRIQIF
jgi:hypothetical protein